MYSLFLWFMIIAAQNQITEEKEELQMAYNQMLQSTIEGVKSIARTDLCLMDTEGNVIAATNEDAQQYKESVLALIHLQKFRLYRDISTLKLWMAQVLNMPC